MAALFWCMARLASRAVLGTLHRSKAAQRPENTGPKQRFFSLARFLLASFFKRHCAIRQVPRHLCMMAIVHLLNSCLRLYLLVLKIIYL
jgi:hypothetical protein